MGEVLQLIRQTVSHETVAALEALLQEAQAGKITGLAYVAIHQGGDFTADAVGLQNSTMFWGLARLKHHLITRPDPPTS